MNLPIIRINTYGIIVLGLCAIFFVFVYVLQSYRTKEDAVTLVSLRQLLSIGIAVAELGGEKVYKVRKDSDLRQQSKGKTKEGANDPLTYGDLLSHRVMFYGLKKSFPKLKIISEEHDDKMEPEDIGPPISEWTPVKEVEKDEKVPINEVLVWIDPLDATQEYTENLLDYITTMVCISVKGKPTIGIIHRPFQNVTVWGWSGKALSDYRLTKAVNMKKTNKPKTIIVSRSHAGKVKEVAQAAFGPETVIIPAGGSGYKTMQVVEGKADAYIHVTLIKKWDICAGNALINALGGKMTTLDGKLIDYGDPNQVNNEKGLVTTLHDHELFLEKLSNLF